MKVNSTIPVLQALLAAALFGVSAPLSKLLLKDFDPIPLAAFLYLGSGLGSLLLYGVQRLQNPGKNVETGLSRPDIPWLTGAILAGGVGAPILLLLGLDRTPASTASLLLNFESVATALIAFLIFKEVADRRILAAVGLVTAAGILLSWTGGNWGFSLGAVGIIAACFLWGLDNNFTRQISGKNPVLIVAIKGLGAGTFSLLLTLILGKNLPGVGVLALAMLVGAVSYGLSIQLFILALRGLGTARTGALFATAPFVGTTLSLVLLREKPEALFWAALPLMLVGAWLMVSENHGHVHVHEYMQHSHAHQHNDEHHAHEHGVSEEPVGEANHAHLHTHRRVTHEHAHAPDLHHRHSHSDK